MGFKHRSFVFVALVAAVISLAATAALASIPIKHIQMHGIEKTNPDVLLNAISLKVGDEIETGSLEALKENAERIINTGYYRSQPEPKLYYEGFEDGAILHIEVVEFPVLNKVVLEGNTVIPSEKLTAKYSQKPGDVINIKKIEAEIIDHIIAQYTDQGYIGVNIEELSVEFEGANIGVVTLKIGEGKLDQITFTGNRKTKMRILRRETRNLQEGTLIRRQDIEKSIQNLRNTGLFENVDVNFVRSEKPGHISIEFTIAEAQTGNAIFGVGYSQVSGISGSLGYRDTNFDGYGKTVSASATLSEEIPGYQFSYTDPYFGKGNSAISLSYYNQKDRQLRNVGSFFESEYYTKTSGAGFGYTYRINDNLSTNVGLGYNDFSYTIRRGDPFLNLTSNQVRRRREKGETRMVSTGLMWDTRDDKYSTTRGQYNYFNAQFAGFGGDFTFQKYIGENRSFFPLTKKGITLALRQSVGMATDNIPLIEEFSLGGAGSIRGIEEDSYFGNHSILLNNEVRVPLRAILNMKSDPDNPNTWDSVTDSLALAFFCDYGAAGEGFDELEGTTTIGAGIRFKIPMLGLGAIRLDYGYEPSTSKSRVEFAFGELF